MFPLTTTPSELSLDKKMRKNKLSSTFSHEDININQIYFNKAEGEEARNFDYVAARPTEDRLTYLEGGMHYFRAMLGGGFLTMHESYQSCGLWLSVLTSIIIGLLLGYNVYSLVKSAHSAYGRAQVPSLTYADLAEASFELGPFPMLRKFAKYFRITVTVTSMITLFFSCVCYQIIAAKGTKDILNAFEDKHNIIHASLRWYIFGMMIPLLIILAIDPPIEFFVPFTTLNVLFVFLVLIATMILTASNISTIPITFRFYKSTAGMFVGIGTTLYSLDGSVGIMAIENAIVEPRKMRKLIITTMTISGIINIILGYFGYWAYYSDIKTPITIHFKWSWTFFGTLLKVVLPFIFLLRYIVNSWMPCQMIWHWMQRFHAPNHHWLFERMYKIFFVLLTTAVALALPILTALMACTGALCVSFLGFIYPAVIDLLLSWKDPGLGIVKWRLLKAIALLVTGATFLFAGSAYSVMYLVEKIKKVKY